MTFWTRNGSSGRSLGPVSTRPGGSLSRSVQEGLRRLDMMVVMDCTGSMANQIEECKRKIGVLFQHIAVLEPIRPDMAAGVLGYRDHPPQDTSVIPHHAPLSSDIAAVQRGLRSFRAHGGGDHPEAVLDGLNEAITRTAWRPHSYRVVVLVGDAPPHGFGSPADYFASGCPCGWNLETLNTTARGYGILMGHAVGVGNCPYMQSSFQEIARRLQGEYVPLGAMESLIARIESLLREAVRTMSEDATVLEEVHRHPTLSSGALAARLGKTLPEVESSLKRLTRRTLTG